MAEKMPAWAEVQVAIDRLRPWGRFLLKTVYERDDFPRDAVFAALPGFEYPDWDCRRIRDLVDHAMHENKHRRLRADMKTPEPPVCPKCKESRYLSYAEYVLHLMPFKDTRDGKVIFDTKGEHLYCTKCMEGFEVETETVDFE
jgi:hypothetical protein